MSSFSDLFHRRAEESSNWQWSIYGKHPSVKDYIRSGQELPFALALADWIEKGYGAIAERQRPAPGMVSWRFWAAGAKDTLLCGIMRDSSDSVGRLYPLLVVGVGPLGGWHERWHVLPAACENTWTQMEHLSTRPFRELKDFESLVRRIKPPQIEPWMMNGEAPDSLSFGHSADDAAGRGDVFIPIRDNASGHLAAIRSWHSHMKTHLSGVPRTAFMGGSPTATYLAFFLRALAARDFVRLWCVRPDAQ